MWSHVKVTDVEVTILALKLEGATLGAVEFSLSIMIHYKKYDLRDSAVVTVKMSLYGPVPMVVEADIMISYVL